MSTLKNPRRRHSSLCLSAPDPDSSTRIHSIEDQISTASLFWCCLLMETKSNPCFLNPSLSKFTLADGSVFVNSQFSTAVKNKTFLLAERKLRSLCWVENWDKGKFTKWENVNYIYSYNFAENCESDYKSTTANI